MYSEMKLAFFVYLWYPKTKVHICSPIFCICSGSCICFWDEGSCNLIHLQGSDVVYDTFLRPIVMQYEPNIEQRLFHLRAKSGQLISFYMKNFADKGTAFFMDVLRYVVSEKPEGSNAEVGNDNFSMTYSV
jgi:receptor expression-enhancing protein 1/2/3/4